VAEQNRTKQRRHVVQSGSDRSAFGERLRLIVDHWPSAERVAHAIGISPSAFRKWLRGETEPGRDRLIKLADATGVSLSWLAAGDGPAPDPHELGEWTAARDRAKKPSAAPSDSFILLPTRAFAAAAGSGDPWPGPATKFIGFRSDWMRHVLGLNHEEVLMETAMGDSMAPGIGDGDMLLVDIREPKISDFGIYILEVRGEHLVKRVQRKFDGALILISDNPVYLPEEISAALATEVKIVGRVVWRGGRL
jgi:phage repressor protein C with HTH and peptisase S24 domain